MNETNLREVIRLTALLHVTGALIKLNLLVN